jgi:hypothetical protein
MGMGLRQGAAQAALLLTLLGCVAARGTQLGPVSRMIPPQPDHCGAKALGALQGKTFVLLADENLIGQLRVIWPRQEVSGDLVATRLNAQVSDTGRITRLFCG